MKRYYINQEARLTEEIIEANKFDSKNIFAISISKACENKQNEPKHFVVNTSVCWHCYYKELFNIMRSKIQKSKRRNFIIHQMNLRSNPSLFLQEIKDLVVDNEVYFDEHDYSTTHDYLDIIEEVSQIQKSNLSEKVTLVLQYLYSKRETGDNYDLGSILNGLGIRYNQADIFYVADILNQERLAIVSKHSDGAAVRINGKGIQTIEEGEINPSNTNQSESLENLLLHIDLKFADLMVEVNLNAFELAKMIEELKEQFGSHAKPTITRIVGMKFAEYFVSEAIKTGVVKPTLKEIAEFIAEQ